MTYLEKLNAALEQERLAKQQEQLEQEHKAAAAWRHAMTPLDQRLKTLLDDIPNQVKDDGLSLPVLQRMLKGRRRGFCHPGELGSALRKLGYKRHRKWKGAQDGFVSLWKKLC